MEVPMTRFRIVIQRVDIEEGQPEQVTDLDQIEVSAPDARFLQKETALDQLEAQALASGHEVMRHLLQRQWERVDQQLVDNYRELIPLVRVKGDGHDPTGRRALCKKVLYPLWNGEVAAAVEVLEAYRRQTKNEERLDELIEYLRNREASLVE
jgi:hypothetical protein